MVTDNSPAAIKTTCPYCGVGCGILVSVDQRGKAEVVGDPTHPANFGRLCAKGMRLGDTLSLDGRLLHPMLRQQDETFAPIPWDVALDEISENLTAIVRKDGPDSVGFYLSGQLLTEDYYVANKLMKGFIGSSNVDTNSRLCMASTVAGHKRAFGADIVPACYEDLDVADLIVLVGSNAAWCHPILFQRIIQSKAKGARIIVIDTRRTITADSADLFLQIAPGGDQALFSGLLVHLAAIGAFDEDYIARHTSGFATALHAARRMTPTLAASAAATGVTETFVSEFYDAFASTPRVVTVFSQGVNQSGQGVDKVNAIINCHLATGRIGKPGASPFSFTGQPNAMGGREVGGLANTLAAHMGFEPENIDRVRRFWNAPRMAQREGLKAVQMFDAIARGEIKALWIAGTNPAASLPDADARREALRKLDFLIVSDNVLSNDTIRSGAHLLLPALAWGEKNGVVTNSERRISRQRAFLPAPGDARPDWAIFAEVARRMGFSGFDYRSVADVFREHAVLSAFENDGRRDFDIGGLAQISDDAYEQLEPTLWPIRAQEAAGQRRFFEQGGFFTPDGRARFVAPAAPTLAKNVSSEVPFRLNTGRVRDQWHTMTRTGLSPRLSRDTPEPFVEISPADAAQFGLIDNGFAEVSTELGSCVLRVRVTDRQPEGQLFVPIHWTDETSSRARVGALVAADLDSLSGQPESKATPAAVAPVAFAWQGFLLTRKPLTFPEQTWWTRIAVDGGVGYRLAGPDDEATWRDFFQHAAPNSEIVGFFDQSRCVLRMAALRGAKADLILSLGPEAESWDHALELFQREELDGSQQEALLANMASKDDDYSSRQAFPRASPQRLSFEKKKTTEEYRKILRRTGLLTQAPTLLLDALIDSSGEFSLETGDLLFAESEPGDAVYLVVDGAVQVFTIAPSGEELVLSAPGKGELIGEHYLLQRSDGRRSASARAARTTTLLRFEEKAFLEFLARQPHVARQFRERRNRREAENLSKRSEIFRLLNSSGVIDPQSAANFSAGALIFREGDIADGAWLIVSGEAAVYHEATPDSPLARLGPGQCFGERACLDNMPRNASVRAITRLKAVKISQEKFLRLHESSPALQTIVSGLQFVYHLPQRGLAVQYVCEKHGEAAIERLYRLDDGRRVLSTWMPAVEAFRFDCLEPAAPENELREYSWIETAGDSPHHRSIRVSRAGEIFGFSSVGEWPEMPQILEAAIDNIRIDPQALRTFEQTGRLDIVRTADQFAEKACFCMQVTVNTVRTLIDSGCTSFESLREHTGCGSLCGGCEPQIQSMLGRAEWIPVTGEANQITEDVLSIVLRPTLVMPIEWKTGQFVVLSGRIGQHWVSRSYTIVSASGDGRSLEIAVKREPRGLFSRWLFEGAFTEKALRISSPRGECVWTPSPRATVCFVAGIGVTPAVAILRTRNLLEHVGPLHVDYSARTFDTMPFIAEFEAARAKHDDVNIVFRITSRDTRLTEEEIVDAIRRYPDADFFICGPDSYMDSVVGVIESQGVLPDRIFEERFTHAGAPIR